MDDSRQTPLEVREFETFRRPAGPESTRLDIADIAIEFQGLPTELAETMEQAYSLYSSAPTGAGDPLQVEVLAAPIDYFIPPRFTRQWEVYRVLTAMESGVFRSVSYRLAAWIDVKRRRAQVALAHGELDPAPRAMENFLRSAVAWLAIQHGGIFLHGASIVREQKAYLFFGPSGAGKSTLSALSREGGVISDDLTLLLRRPSGLVAAGGPFRGTYKKGRPIIGTFPVAAMYRIRKDSTICVKPDDGGCFADLIGNLPFVVDQLPHQMDLFDHIRSVVAGVPFRYLHFTKDGNFWPVLDEDLRSREIPG